MICWGIGKQKAVFSRGNANPQAELKPLGRPGTHDASHRQTEKVFWFFFSKKNRFLASPPMKPIIGLLGVILAAVSVAFNDVIF
jgi:hypothetical protein